MPDDIKDAPTTPPKPLRRWLFCVTKGALKPGELHDATSYGLLVVPGETAQDAYTALVNSHRARRGSRIILLGCTGAVSIGELTPSGVSSYGNFHDLNRVLLEARAQKIESIRADQVGAAWRNKAREIDDVVHWQRRLGDFGPEAAGQAAQTGNATGDRMAYQLGEDTGTNTVPR
jgi:hypothetical protein